ncbi:hypothetical protein KFL_006090050 [Klebsormidium nitens]|uniref:Uncharacterized protein n=1 Tax=Klebsormidium nitens TaxID=105231 RepID=A0A1Y1IL61_KLENI|nr:hypothetical protein KFL_006090050 [Klebsormidium nitens]|eukprot:GAQ90179.1 hypothetical protein KFL_006090050 [Klebsormidium nitens]
MADTEIAKKKRFHIDSSDDEETEEQQQEEESELEEEQEEQEDEVVPAPVLKTKSTAKTEEEKEVRKRKVSQAVLDHCRRMREMRSKNPKPKEICKTEVKKKVKAIKRKLVILQAFFQYFFESTLFG